MNRLNWILLLTIVVTAVSTARAEELKVPELFAGPDGQRIEDQVRQEKFAGDRRPVEFVWSSVGARLTVYAANPDHPRTFTLYAMDDPQLVEADYVLRGRLRYTDLEGAACLDLICEWPDGSITSVRTMENDRGPMRKITGSHTGRDFRVPLPRKPGVKPVRIVVNLFPPGKAVIDFDGPMKLVDARGESVAARTVSTHEKATTASGPFSWLDLHVAVALCLLVGVSGLSVFPMRALVRRGKGRSLVLGIVALIALAGLVQLFGAGVAVGAGKSVEVWIILLGGGAIGTLIPVLMMWDVNKQYMLFELRKMHAMDVA